MNLCLIQILPSSLLIFIELKLVIIVINSSFTTIIIFSKVTTSISFIIPLLVLNCPLLGWFVEVHLFQHFQQYCFSLQKHQEVVVLTDLMEVPLVTLTFVNSELHCLLSLHNEKMTFITIVVGNTSSVCYQMHHRIHHK